MCSLPPVPDLATTIAGLRIFPYWVPIIPQVISQQVESGRLYRTPYNMENGYIYPHRDWKMFKKDLPFLPRLVPEWI